MSGLESLADDSMESAGAAFGINNQRTAGVTGGLARRAAPVPAINGAANSNAAAMPAASGPAPTRVIARGEVLLPEDIQGSPQEQLEFVTRALVEFSDIGTQAEDLVVLNKAVLLEASQDRGLHIQAGYTNWGTWASEVLDVDEIYVFELLADARRLRALQELGSEVMRHLVRASSRKIVANVLEAHGAETAKKAVEDGAAIAVARGKKRPTAAMLKEAVATLLALPGGEPQGSESGSESALPAGRPSTAATDSASGVLAGLGRVAIAVRERAYAPLAPAAIKLAAETDPVAAAKFLDDIGAELENATKRLTSARRLVADELSRQPVDAEIVEDDAE